MENTFYHLHLHTEYSMLDGLCRLEALFAEAEAQGLDALAVTDHHNMSGVVKFVQLAQEHGIKPIIGVELKVGSILTDDPSENKVAVGGDLLAEICERMAWLDEQDGDDPENAELTPEERENAVGDASRAADGREVYHLTVLAKDNLGYTNILKLISRSNLTTDGIVTKAMLAAHKQGLIVLSGCGQSELDRALHSNEPVWKSQAASKKQMGSIGQEEPMDQLTQTAQRLQRDQIAEDRATAVARAYRDLFGQNNYYIELQRVGRSGEDELIRRKVELGRQLQVAIVATNNVHYLKREDAKTHQVLNGIQRLSGEVPYPQKLHEEYYLKRTQEMIHLFRDLPEAIENTVQIAERCHVTLDLDQLHFPQFPVPEDHTRESYLRHLCYRGLEERFGKSPSSKALNRLEFELETINRMGYAGYFLIMWDIVQYARQQGILTAGRGSAVSSFICYLLKITTVDPIEYELYFERFLNPERASMPDIDLDIDHVGRKQILHYIAQKYGQENMAHLSAFSTLAPKAVVRDVARVQGWPEEKLTPLTRFVSHQNIHEIECPTNGGDFRELYYRNAAFRHLINTARQLEGLPRHWTQHSAGVVISPDSLTNYTSLQFARDGQVITQFDMRSIEDLGLLKIDLLGVRFLSAIRYTLKHLWEKKGIRLTLETIPLNDLPTYQLIQSGDTIGCFQLESGGCRKLLQQLKPANLKEIMFATSLYRPGPIEGGMVQRFVARLHQQEEIEYPHPLLVDLLKETYGVVLFQEQVMLIARDLAGFSLGEADLLRKAIAKKDLQLWAELKSKFLKGAMDRGLTGEEAQHIFDTLHKFAGYGFCKAHAAAYAHIAYVTAFLKVHYPVEYFTALFNVNLDFDCRIRQYLNQCRYHKITVLPPDINNSQLIVTTDGEKIRMGLLMIKGLGRKAAKEIIARREEGGSYRSLADFCRRVDPGLVHRTVLESLIKAGAFEGLGDRIQLLWSCTKIWREAKEHRVDAGQLRCIPLQTQVQTFIGSAPQVDLMEVLRWELETMGHPISAHPLACLDTGEAKVQTIDQLMELKQRQVQLAGEITALRFRWTQKGTLVCFFTLEDRMGTTEVTAFEPVVSHCKRQLFSGNIILLKAKLEKKAGIYDLIAEEIVPL